MEFRKELQVIESPESAEFYEKSGKKYLRAVYRQKKRKESF